MKTKCDKLHKAVELFPLSKDIAKLISGFKTGEINILPITTVSLFNANPHAEMIEARITNR